VRIVLALTLVFLLGVPAVRAADPRPPVRAPHPTIEPDDGEIGDEDDTVEPSLPDDEEPRGSGDQLEDELPSRPQPAPGVRPHASPLPPDDEDPEAPPAKGERTDGGYLDRADRANPSQPLGADTR